MNKEEQRNYFAGIALAQLLLPENFSGVLAGADAKNMPVNRALAVTCVDLADALIAELHRTKPEPEPLQPEGFPDFQKWTAYEGLDTIKEGDEDIFAHRNLSSLTERHNRAIAAFREWACRQAKAPQPDPDGWIPHRPGDPMPCDGGSKVLLKLKGGYKTDNWIDARYFDWGKHNGGDNIIAWKPA